MVASDGMKLTLGDTTIMIYITPGHTPGTLSTLVPLKDGNDKHLGYILGGRGAEWDDYGVKYFSDGLLSNFRFFPTQDASSMLMPLKRKECCSKVVIAPARYVPFGLLLTAPAADD